MILFLDYDGVVHPVFPRSDLSDQENQLFSYLPRLENVLRDFPDVRIVIASSWRDGRPWENVIKPFSLDIAAKIVGATPVIRVKEPPYPRYPRFNEVQAFLEANGGAGARWIALDDDSEIYPPGCSNLILCDDGFGDAEEQMLRTLLAEAS